MVSGAFRTRWVALVTLSTALVLAACGGSGFQYVKNGEYNAYFKVDEDWTLFDERQYLSHPGLALEPMDRQRKLATTWIRGFDASPQASVSNLFDDAAAEPHGLARIQLLTEAERDSVDLSSLRSAQLGFDPVEVKRDEPEGPVEVLAQSDVSLDGGEHGVRLVVAFDAPGGSIGIIDQTAVVDSSNSILYLFVVGCSRSCYVQNQDIIDEVANSWTIEKKG